jgi:hypothetical protein
VVWYENPRPSGNPATDTWTEHLIGAAGADDHDLEVADLNGDDKLDVVTRPQHGGVTNVWLQVTPTTWTRVIASNSTGDGTALGDVDRDGDVDIGQNGFWIENLGGGQSWGEHKIVSGWPEESGVLNRGSRPQRAGRRGALACGEHGPAVVVRGRAIRAAARGPSTRSTRDTSYLHTFKCADMDKDGDLDLVTAEMHHSRRPRRGERLPLTMATPARGTQQVIAHHRLAQPAHRRLRSRRRHEDIYGANHNDDAPNSGGGRVLAQRSEQRAAARSLGGVT